MEDINYNDNNRIVIRRENFEQIILNINNKDIKYTFMDLNEYILFLKIIMYENDEKLFKKCDDIKKEYKDYNLCFNKDIFYEDLENININRFKAIKYYGDTKHKIINYCRNNQETDINKLICKLKYNFINIEFINNIEYDFIYFVLNEISINERSINIDIYDKLLCKKHFDELINKKNIVKKASLILGGTIGFAGGLFAYLQSIGITLSVIQSISMTGVTVTIGVCSLSGASLIILPGLTITYKDIIENQELKKEIEIYINNIIN